jgi:hypothetical protein
VVGLRAATLMRVGETARANKLLEQLTPGTAYGVPMARMIFHLGCSEVDQGVAWAENAIEQRPGRDLSSVGTRPQDLEFEFALGHASTDDESARCVVRSG